MRLSIQKCDELQAELLISYSKIVANQKHLRNMSFSLNEGSPDTGTVSVLSEMILKKANNNLFSIELDLQSC